MMAAPSYEFYTDTYRGTLSEDEFNAQLSVSVAHVDWLTGFKAVSDDNETAYQMAVCATVDTFGKYGTGLVDGFSIGSFRMDRPNDGKFTAREIANEAAYEFLAPTGLLWSGIR